jgi:hypothetical protein
MPLPPPPPGPPPGWYRRLSPRLQRVAARSDGVPTLPLAAGPTLRGLVARLPDALATGRADAVQPIAQRIASGICAAFKVGSIRVVVELRRPANSRGELHGLYVPSNGDGRDLIRLWMMTARRGQVVAFRTFLRTLLHELCHHLDYTLLGLPDSLHTQGFYRRESSLFHALGAGTIDSP